MMKHILFTFVTLAYVTAQDTIDLTKLLAQYGPKTVPVQNSTADSAIAKHLVESGSNHWIELHNPQVISTERHYIPRLVQEAIEITKHRNFNREDGFQLSGTWNPVAPVKPTSALRTAIHQDSGSCQCVPYYACDEKKRMVDPKNPTVITWTKIDRRIGTKENSQCTESVEVCCNYPSNYGKPKPDLELRGCGYRNPNGLGASIISDTHESQFGEYPWVVALIDNVGFSYIGMGVIIHPQVIMTVAHYAYKYSPNGLRIRAGEWDLQTEKEMYDYQERVVQNITYHSEFVRKNLKNDIALLRLEEPLQFAKHINTLCLPDLNENFDNSQNCVSNGWGKDIFGPKGRYANILKEITQDIVPHDRCQSLLQQTRLKKKFRLHSSFVCAEGESDSCQGDGGAPLACPIGNERYKLAGLVAGGIGCGQKDVPGVFTNVSAFRTWVDDKMRDWGFGTSSYTI